MWAFPGRAICCIFSIIRTGTSLRTDHRDMSQGDGDFDSRPPAPVPSLSQGDGDFDLLIFLQRQRDGGKPTC